MAIKVNEENFDKEVLKSDIPVMTVFYAEWLAASKLIDTFIEEIDAEYTRVSEAYNVPVEQVKSMVMAEDIKADLLVAKAMNVVKDNAKVK